MSNIKQDFSELRSFYRGGTTRSLAYRTAALNRMLRCMEQDEETVLQALQFDLGKSNQEAYVTELAIVYKEIRRHARGLKRWAKEKKVSTPLFLIPSRSRIQAVPYGTVLIMAPWNYPLQLALLPLIGAIAAGNTVLLKCSPFAPKTSVWIHKLVQECFEPGHVRCVYAEHREGDYLLNREALSLEWDFIFYTGSSAMGKVVMEAASKHLIPVCLELGGKSPCIVDAGTPLALAARRIVWGKLINAGQTCVAPDFVYVSRTVKQAFIQHCIREMEALFGDFRTNPHYGRIVHKEALLRLQDLLHNQQVIYGGTAEEEERFMAPCIVDEPDWNSPLMQEEIFGPILPVLAYDSLQDLCALLAEKAKPLALYVFATPVRAKYVLQQLPSGGACVNDVILHVSNTELPFGGIGKSGQGNYHGKASFDCFSHYRSVLISSTSFDFNLKYPPYKAFSWIRRAMH